MQIIFLVMYVGKEADDKIQKIPNLTNVFLG